MANKFVMYGYSSPEQLRRAKKIKRCRVITHDGFIDALCTIHKFKGDKKVKITMEVVDVK